MNKGNCGVYEILNTKNGKRYIGSSKELEKRFSQHRASLRNNNHKNNHLQRAFNKYGEENFNFSIIVYCDKSRRIDYEQYWINRLNACNPKNGYNIADEAQGGCGLSGKEHPAWKEKAEILCEYCDNSFKVNPSREDSAIYCSYSCRSKDIDKVKGEDHPFWEGGKVELSCENCGDIYQVKKNRKEDSNFCSEECFYSKNKGEESGNSKLKKSQVKSIKRLIKKGAKTYKEIAELFNTSSSNINKIANEKTWSHVKA